MAPKIQLDILTLFPQYFDSPLKQSILGRAVDNKLIRLNLYNLRDYALDSRKTVDSRPYGGGAGMVLKADILVRALESISTKGAKPYTILLDPKGKSFNQEYAENSTRKKRILLVCGRYEGVDERFIENWVDDTLSVGDYVLSGGEPAALVVIDAVSRLLPGALGNEGSKETESFSKSKGGSNPRILDYPVYTRPEVFRNKKVPEVLLSGDHKQIESWRREKALTQTKKLRPDLITSRQKDL